MSFPWSCSSWPSSWWRLADTFSEKTRRKIEIGNWRSWKSSSTFLAFRYLLWWQSSFPPSVLLSGRAQHYTLLFWNVNILNLNLQICWSWMRNDAGFCWPSRLSLGLHVSVWQLEQLDFSVGVARSHLWSCQLCHAICIDFCPRRTCLLKILLWWLVSIGDTWTAMNCDFFFDNNHCQIR